MGFFGQNKYKKEVSALKNESLAQRKRIKQLEKLSDEKDDFFKELMSDATRHGSSLGAKHMSDRSKYVKGK